jgi:hypothetical protein
LTLISPKGELISRLVVIEVQDVPNHGKIGSVHSRSQAVRCLLAGLLGLIQTANQTEVVKSQEEAMDVTGPKPETSRKDDSHVRASRRSRVSPDIWQDTLSLLCDNDYAVRADYTEALIFYLSNEMPKHGDVADPDGFKRVHRLAEGPLQQAVNITVLHHAGDFGTKFLNAVHAYLYIFSTTSSFGLTSSASPSQSTMNNSHINVIPSTPTEVEIEGRDSFAQAQSGSGRSFSAQQGPRSQKSSVVRRLLNGTTDGVSASTAASLADYTHIFCVLTTIHEQLPARGLLTGVPMLLALDASTRSQDLDDLHTLHRINVIREVVARVWLVIGKVWKSSDITDLAEKVCELYDCLLDAKGYV